jgi:hypothetical protein
MRSPPRRVKIDRIGVCHPLSISDMGHYEEILSALVDEDVDFIVVGGVACVLHGVERVTMDVDLAVATDPDNFAKFLAVMERLGLKPRVPINPRSLLDKGVLDHIIHEKHALVFFLSRPRQTDPTRRHVPAGRFEPRGCDRSCRNGRIPPEKAQADLQTEAPGNQAGY